MRSSFFLAFVILILFGIIRADTPYNPESTLNSIYEECDDPKTVLWIGKQLEYFDPVLVGVETPDPGNCFKLKIQDVMYGDIEDLVQHNSCDEPNAVLSDSILWVNEFMNTASLGTYLIAHVEVSADNFIMKKWEFAPGSSIIPAGFNYPNLSGLMDIEELQVVLDEICLNATGVGDTESPRIEIFPNPANRFVQIKFSEADSNDQFVVFDITGRVVCRVPATQEITMINVYELNAGTYLLGLEKSGQLIGADKLVISPHSP